MLITENDLSAVCHGNVLSASGEKVGSVGHVYLDAQTGQPSFVTANTGLFGTSHSFVPLRGARVENGDVVVDFDRTTVKDAPRIEDDGSLSPAEEDELYAYYGMGRSDADTDDYGIDGQTPEPHAARVGDGDGDGDRDLATGPRDRHSDTREDDGPVPGRDGDSPAAGDPTIDPGTQGRLRKWVMTEYEPVKTTEVYVDGSAPKGSPSDTAPPASSP